jgi:hypothetical protein
MTCHNRHFHTFTFLLSVLFCITAGAQPMLSPQEAKQTVQLVVNTDLSAGAADNSHWLYREFDQNPKRKVVQWVAQASTTDLPRLVEEDSQRLSEAQQRQRLEAFLRDRSAQARERKKQQEDIKQTVDLLKLLPVAFLWTTTGNQHGETTLHFKPDPGFHPPNVEARILGAVEGDMVIDSAQHRIVRLKGQLVHDVKFGGGILGQIKSGGTFAIERKEIIPGVWQITETHVHFAGHMLLFKSVSEQEDDERSNFRRLPDGVSLDEARNELFRTNDIATNSE